jgi:hypothetical protein
MLDVPGEPQIRVAGRIERLVGGDRCEARRGVRMPDPCRSQDDHSHLAVGGSRLEQLTDRAGQG